MDALGVRRLSARIAARARSGAGLENADLAYLAGSVVGVLALVLLGAAAIWLDPSPANDFAEDRLGFRLLLEGRDPYDPVTWALALGSVGRTPVTSAFVLPPYAIILYLPFALIALAPAWMLWTIAGPTLAAAALGMLLRAWEVPGPARLLLALALLCSEGALVALGEGQQSFFLTAALAAAVVWIAHGREVKGGLAIAALAGKPQIFLLAIWSLIAQAVALRRRGALAAIAVVGAPVLATVTLTPRIWQEWSATIAPFVGRIPRLSTTIDTSFVAIFGATGHVIAAAAVIASVVLMIRIAPRGDHPGWLALSIAAAPYAQRYDHVALVVPLAVATGLAARVSTRRAVAFAAAGAVLLGPTAAALYVAEGAPAAADPYGGLVPLAMFALVLLMGREVRDQRVQI